ncbi:MAG: hypothetical protein MUC76_00355 [Spirochaetes bacterium]|jgi:hypothetical protein|nr:hypothetical protein [Spirochaetota bacterium]
MLTAWFSGHKVGTFLLNTEEHGGAVLFRCKGDRHWLLLEAGEKLLTYNYPTYFVFIYKNIIIAVSGLCRAGFLPEQK